MGLRLAGQNQTHLEALSGRSPLLRDYGSLLFRGWAGHTRRAWLLQIIDLSI